MWLMLLKWYYVSTGKEPKQILMKVKKITARALVAAPPFGVVWTALSSHASLLLWSYPWLFKVLNFFIPGCSRYWTFPVLLDFAFESFHGIFGVLSSFSPWILAMVWNSWQMNPRVVDGLVSSQQIQSSTKPRVITQRSPVQGGAGRAKWNL